MLISVIIVAYNSEDFIEKCIKSALKYLPREGEVLVVDNASTDQTAKVLEKFGNKISLIKSEKNLGFAKGNNLAAKQAKGEYLFLLNPDTEITQPVFEKLIQFYNSNKARISSSAYEETSDAGIVAPKLIMLDGKVQASVKNLPTVIGAFKEYILGIKNSYSEYVPEGDKPKEVGIVYGAAMLVKKDLFEKVKGFDEKYFMYYEDADLCKRIRSLGKKVYYYPGVSIRHIVGGVKTDTDRYKLNYDSFVKYHGHLGSFLLNLIFQVPRIKRAVVK